MKISYLFILILSLGLFTNCEPNERNKQQSNPIVRVRILHQQSDVRIVFKDKWQLNAQMQKASHNSATSLQIQNGDTLYLRSFEQGFNIRLNQNSELNILGKNHLILIPIAENSEITIEEVPYGVGWWWEGVESRVYEGEIHFYHQAEYGWSTVVHLPLEQYLLGVVPYEIGPQAPIEALKAQAVAARSEAIKALSSALYSGPFHDLTSDVECQVFAGNKRRNNATDLAVQQTTGLVLTENNQVIHAYYASNCGGASEPIQYVWPEREMPSTYVKARIDFTNRALADLSDEEAFSQWLDADNEVWCNPERGIELPAFSQQNHRWVRAFTKQEWHEMLNRHLPSDHMFEEINFLERGPSGRLKKVELVSKDGAKLIVEEELNIRQLWKPALRSAAFTMSVDSLSDQILLKGAGWGHGVGMCQSGAIAMAKSIKPYDFNQILTHYYPGTKTMLWYSLNETKSWLK